MKTNSVESILTFLKK